MNNSFARVGVRCIWEDKASEGFVFRRNISSGERIIRAAKMTAILWGVALVCVLIPMAHFVLVPGFFLAGIVFGITTWMSKGEISHGEVTCPVCEKTMQIAKEDENWPKSERCHSCSVLLTITMA